MPAAVAAVSVAVTVAATVAATHAAAAATHAASVPTVRVHAAMATRRKVSVAHVGTRGGTIVVVVTQAWLLR